MAETELQTMDPRGSIIASEKPAQINVQAGSTPSVDNHHESQNGEEEQTAVQTFDQNVEEQQKQQKQSEAVLKNENFLGGTDNPVFAVNEETSLMERIIPPVTYIDFLPQFLLASESKQEAPTYARFGTLVEQANQWLQGNQEYTVWKCETVIFKLKTDESLNIDETLYSESAFGINKYIMGLRLWLIPRPSEAIPVCQIGVATWLPGQRTVIAADNSPHANPVSYHMKTRDFINAINKSIMKKPLPGTIMNCETVVFRVSCDRTDGVSIDSEQTCWAELGRNSTAFVHGLRVFYVRGKAEYTQIGYHDQEPSMETRAMQTVVKFGPFKDTVKKMGTWLKSQKDIRVVNLQSINVQLHAENLVMTIDSSSMGYKENPSLDARYAKVLRTYYVTTTKSDNLPYQSVQLSTRLFIPVRIMDKEFESFSKTMQRVIKWFEHTKLPPFGVETVQYLASIMSYGSVVQENKSDVVINRSNGRHFLTTVRFYFPSEFTEPPPEISPEVTDADATAWGCNIS
ncbi:hypothetical protein FSP39_019462 [Pinctada imbricata]|uniref:Uncharacterized protein n=1 Tax=Pinctada imbricata TaxID=66713 RepID=A0AA88XWC4_PINIB|nr:hypothetical protein FSP39_019462 [Pinctada imbricata]